MNTKNNFIKLLWMILFVLLFVSTQNFVLAGTHTKNNSSGSGTAGSKNVLTDENIKLLYPVNGDSINTGQLPYFAWGADSSISSSVQTYNLKIVKILAGQTLSFAIMNNKPFFEKDGIKESYLQYPTLADSFSVDNYYGWVVQAMDKDGSPVGTNNGSSAPAMLRKGGNIILHDTLSELTLFNPGPGSIIYRGQLPYFTWGSKSSLADSISAYKLKIAEILGNELPEEALKTSNPFFETDTIKTTYFQFPAEADSFIIGSNYVWNVQALDKNGNLLSDSTGTGSPNLFRKGGTIIPFDTINVAAFALLSPADSSEISFNTPPHFSWQLINNSPLSSQNYKITVTEILNGQTPAEALKANKPFFEKDKLTEQFIDYPETAAFKAGSKYAWMIQIYKKDGTTIWNDPVKNSFTFKISNPTNIAENSERLPGNFRLAQNYPNPFNPTTKINYSIPKASFVSIKIYDVLGREVETLVNDEKHSGNYNVEFNANNLSSGIYFYRMQAGSFMETKKLLLLK